VVTRSFIFSFLSSNAIEGFKLPNWLDANFFKSKPNKKLA
jgi:hypothetical protein